MNYWTVTCWFVVLHVLQTCMNTGLAVSNPLWSPFPESINVCTTDERRQWAVVQCAAYVRSTLIAAVIFFIRGENPDKLLLMACNIRLTLTNNCLFCGSPRGLQNVSYLAISWQTLAVLTYINWLELIGCASTNFNLFGVSFFRLKMKKKTSFGQSLQQTFVKLLYVRVPMY